MTEGADQEASAERWQGRPPQRAWLVTTYPDSLHPDTESNASIGAEGPLIEPEKLIRGKVFSPDSVSTRRGGTRRQTS